MRKVIWMAVWMTLVLAVAAAAGPTDAATVAGYLKEMHVDARQASPGSFEFELGFPQAKPEKFLVRVLTEQKLVYIGIVDLARVAPADTAAFRRMADLNYKLAVGKIEWDAATGEVRLSYTFASEEAVDRASFVAVMQTLLTEVDAARRALGK